MKVALLYAVVSSMMLFTAASGAQEALDAPEWRRPGLWQIAIAAEGQSLMQAVTVHQCSSVEHEPEILLSILPGQENCKAPLIERNGDSVTIRTHCTVHSMDVFDSTFTMAGDFKLSYQGNTQHTVRRGFSRVHQGQGTHFIARWVGECPDDMRSGDMRLSNGVVVNVIDHRRQAESEGR